MVCVGASVRVTVCSPRVPSPGVAVITPSAWPPARPVKLLVPPRVMVPVPPVVKLPASTSAVAAASFATASVVTSAVLPWTTWPRLRVTLPELPVVSVPGPLVITKAGCASAPSCGVALPTVTLAVPPTIASPLGGVIMTVSVSCGSAPSALAGRLTVKLA